MEIIVFAKPLALASGRVQKVKSFIEKFDAAITEVASVVVNKELIKAHYAEHSAKSFFSSLTEYYIGKTIVVFRVQVKNEDCIADIRSAMGPSSIALNTFRHDLVSDVYDEWTAEHGPFDNGIHASDSAEAGARECSIWF